MEIKIKDLQKEYLELCKSLVGKPFVFLETDYKHDFILGGVSEKIYDWIQENYIPKDKVRELKLTVEKVNNDWGKLPDVYAWEAYQKLVDFTKNVIKQFNNSIDKLLK